MTITLNSSWGAIPSVAPAFNVYADLSEAADYLCARTNGGSFTSLGTTLQQQLLIQASQDIDRLEVYEGVKKLPTQALEFPRAGSGQRMWNGLYVEAYSQDQSLTIWEAEQQRRVKRAVLEQALWLALNSTGGVGGSEHDRMRQAGVSSFSDGFPGMGSRSFSYTTAGPLLCEAARAEVAPYVAIGRVVVRGDRL